MKSCSTVHPSSNTRRSPHGERGLKSVTSIIIIVGERRSPHGERGLKCLAPGPDLPGGGRSPHGERGLKSCHARYSSSCSRSLPTRGAWIEIRLFVSFFEAGQSLPTRGAWIEIRQSRPPGSSRGRRSPHGERGLKSHSHLCLLPLRQVAPHTGSVD